MTMMRSQLNRTRHRALAVTFRIVLSCAALWTTTTMSVATASNSEMMDVSISTTGFAVRSSSSHVENSNTTTTAETLHHHHHDPYLQLERIRELKESERIARRERNQQRRAKVKEIMQKLPQPRAEQLERISPEEWERMNNNNNNDDDENTRQRRGLNWFSGGTGGNSMAYSSSVLVDPSQYYDKWAQAYRMLGGYIDCDHDKDEGSHDRNDNNNNNNNNNNQGNGACSRWMIWAAFVNPNYQGNEYDEYFGENPTSVLDCHNPDTDWELLGVYRQEFYQYIEQISKHLWAIDEYEYVVALAGLKYMTKYDCFYVGNDKNGNAIYAGVAPQPYGKFQMALYTDERCLTPDNSLGMTYDDFGLQSDVSLGSKDNGNGDYDNVEEWWSNAQEYTLTDLNDVYEEFKYCTSCVDYPTYQDGYFIGDYGTDDDDLINQCWKFYSHDSFVCEAECIAMAHAQGTILSIKYGDAVFGKTEASFYMSKSAAGGESKFQRLLANSFLTVSFLLFIATFLAFAVARRSRYRESRRSKSRRLLDDSDRRSKSRRRGDSDGDGLFRASSKSRSKSRSKRTSSSGRRSRSKSYEAPRETKSKSPRTKNDGDYF